LTPRLTYLSLIQRAFQPEYWQSAFLVDEGGVTLGGRLREPGGTGFYQSEYNFPLFFGLAIQAYESTLVSDDSPYDRYLDGQRDALTTTQQVGLAMFQRRSCATCHVDPELTLATYSGVFGNGGFPALGPDAGFFYTGVEPATNDIGLAGDDSFGQPLSRTVRAGSARSSSVRALFKTPSLRNVELTGPYFHTGSKSTLEQIVDFYTGGGDYFSGSLTRWGPDPTERVAMPALMRAFTDDRVRFERAPFDHPELCVSIGHVGDDKDVKPHAQGAHTAAERWALVPAVGSRGNRVPLQTFEELLLGVGDDGSRAHALIQPCAPR
jgi:hypothetical protein